MVLEAVGRESFILYRYCTLPRAQSMGSQVSPTSDQETRNKLKQRDGDAGEQPKIETALSQPLESQIFPNKKTFNTNE